MSHTMLGFGAKSKAEERAAEKRLRDAERELESLRRRANKVVRVLTERHKRNHWRESIEQLIQGAL